MVEISLYYFEKKCQKKHKHGGTETQSNKKNEVFLRVLHLIIIKHGEKR
jgi:hypothetical protein